MRPAFFSLPAFTALTNQVRELQTNLKPAAQAANAALCGAESKMKGYPAGTQSGRTDGDCETCIERETLARMRCKMTAAGTGKGLSFERFFTDGKVSFDAVEWEKRRR